MHILVLDRGWVSMKGFANLTLPQVQSLLKRHTTLCQRETEGGVPRTPEGLRRMIREHQHGRV